MRDRIVVIGSTAASLRDFFYTSHSHQAGGDAKPIAGIELQAQFISQLLRSALEGRSPIQYLAEPLEWLWILAWSVAGVMLCWRIRSPKNSMIGMVVLGGGLVGMGYLTFWMGWWIPLVSPLMALSGSAMVTTGRLARTQDKLRKSREFLNLIINAIPDPVFVKDQDRRCIVLNKAFCELVSASPEQLLYKTEFDFLPPDQAEQFQQQDEQAFCTGIARENEGELTNCAGVTYAIATKRSLLYDTAGNPFLVGVIRDMTQRKQMEKHLRNTAAELVRSNAELRQAQSTLTQIAYQDALTGLPNRKALQRRLRLAIEWAKQHQKLIGVLFLDLDGFKSVNDNYGHRAGDWLLQRVAQRLSGCLRSSDVVARLGGDEFIALLPGIPSTADLSRVANKILATLSQSYPFEGKLLSISTSIGMSLYPNDSQDQEELVKQADAAMYLAKKLGKNRAEFFRVNVAEPQASFSNSGCQR